MRGSGRADGRRRGSADTLTETPGRLVVAVLSPVLALLLALALPGPSGAALWPVSQQSNEGSASDAPRDRLNTAAGLFTGAAEGAGLTFDVVQRSVLHAKPGGPQIEIPHPTDRYRYLGFTDRLYIGGLVADGTIARDGFYLVMRAGPATEEAAADFGGELQMASLTRGSKTWRNDGEGWYETDRPPGIGLDTATVALLPRLLREAANPTEAGSKPVDGRAADVIRASGKVANAPGLLAIDGADFTELREPIAFALDAQGRVIELTAVMRNTNLDLYDLIVTTTITFHYDAVPALPEPLPAAPPPATPAPESAGVDR
jgi:hypothetical protein